MPKQEEVGFTKVTVERIHPTLGEVLREIARQTNCTVEVDAGGVVLRENP